MNREEFGKLVARLRKEITDLRTGKFLTAKELATRSNLLEKTISEIERGRKMNLDPETLTNLATGLGLTSLERSALLVAASEISIEPLPGIDPPELILQKLLTATQTLCIPAMIYDSYYNIIAGNSMMVALSGIEDITSVASDNPSPANFNLLRYIFADDLTYREVTGPRWKSYGRRTVQQFRATSLKYRYTERFNALFVDLCNHMAFQEAWTSSKYTNNDMHNRAAEYDYVHPKYGPLNYISVDSVTLTGREDLFLATHIPRNRETMRTYEELGRGVGLNMHRLTSWPYKD